MSWVVVPLSRPECVANVKENFERQSHEGKKLCIVENGGAQGACKAAEYEPDMLLTSEEAHPSAARNAGLVALRDLDAHVSFMDDDDYYGSYYQEEQISFADRNRITGKMTNWVRFEQVGKLWLFNRAKATKPSAWVQAATIGGYARTIPDFPVVDLGEELDLCTEFRKNGGEVRSTSVGHFCYMRSLDERSHLYKITPRGFANQHGPWFEEFRDDKRLLDEGMPPVGIRKSYAQV